MSEAPRFPTFEFPADEGLTDLPKLFDPEWVWETYRREWGRDNPVPEEIQVRQFTHSIGRRAIVSYVVEWDLEEYLPSDHFIARVEAGKAAELFRFPEDADLPGLKEAADPRRGGKVTEPPRVGNECAQGAG